MQTYKCTWCGNEISCLTKSQRDGLNRRGRVYCSPECGKAYSRYISSETMRKTNLAYASERMRKNNPMHNKASREKMKATLIEKGIAPVVRCGNGSGLTAPQAQLLLALAKYGPIPEYGVSTLGAEGRFPSIYKVDVAIPQYKLAIEADGRSHSALKRKRQDAKKDNFLRGKGWTVIRFKNEDINEHLPECLMRLEDEISAIKALSTRVS